MGEEDSLTGKCVSGCPQITDLIVNKPGEMEVNYPCTITLSS